MQFMTWMPVRPERAGALTDARLQLHHAAQLAAAAGISYLPSQPDDRHTNLEWLVGLGALASNPITVKGTTVRVAVRVSDLALLVVGGASEIRLSMPLVGRSMASAVAWLRRELSAAGLRGDAYSLKRHYEIPAHAVATGAAFSASADDLEQLRHWIANAASLFEKLRASTSGASDVRCWPHHFDIATLITARPGATVGVGLELGDAYYAEPYFYVNAYPAPNRESLPASLRGGGSWHTREWIGAVLPGSRVDARAASPELQVAEFVASAVAACRVLLG